MITEQQIDALIEVRNGITGLNDPRGLTEALNALDAVLREVPPGQRNDVDLLLGRASARLEHDPIHPD